MAAEEFPRSLVLAVSDKSPAKIPPLRRSRRSMERRFRGFARLGELALEEVGQRDHRVGQIARLSSNSKTAFVPR